MKNHQRVREKVDYERWIHFRKLVDRARCYLSWREVSLQVGKDNAGWATNAYDHRGLVSESDIQDLEELVGRLESHPDKEKGKMKETVEKGATVEQRREHFGNLVSQLRDSGIRDADIARAMGYERESEVERLLSDVTRAPSHERIQRLQGRASYLIRGAQEMEERIEGIRENGARATDFEFEETEKPADRTPIQKARDKIMDAAGFLERAKEEYPAIFHPVLDEQSEKLLEIAGELDG